MTSPESEAAARLRAAADSGVPCSPVRDLIGADDVAAAYAVQSIIIGDRVAAGATVVGRKIGLTSVAVQKQLGVDQPDFGMLFADMAVCDGEPVAPGRVLQAKVEAEIAFIMSSDLAGADVSRDDVLAATGHIAPALEILDTRVQRRDPATGHVRNVIDTIADNAANAGIVLGDRHLDPVRTDMRWMGAIVRRDDVVEETGLGAGVLGDPVMGIVWLVHRMARYGQKLRRGDVVLSGSFIRPIETAPGVLIHADFGPYGEVSCRFE